MIAELNGYTVIKPHHEPSMPYGYRFDAIDLIKLTDFDEAFNLFQILKVDHRVHDIRIGANNPHTDRIIWEVASHIEGNFGPPYEAILVFSEAHGGDLSIYTPKVHRWWNNDRWSNLSNYLMGLRSLIDLLKRD